MSRRVGIGPIDPLDSPAIRPDGYLRDGDGGIYWWLATVLPGFRQFRYPAKLFTFTAFGMAALAGLGWDRVTTGRARGIALIFLMFLAITLATLAGVLMKEQPILTWFRAGNSPSIFGPFDAALGYRAILQSLAQAAPRFRSGPLADGPGTKAPRLAGAVALIVVTADLATANGRLILTVPQSVFETRPELLKIIEAAEGTGQSPGPFRIHHMPLWHPPGWTTTPSRDRIAELVTWQRDTLQPKHGISLGAEFVFTPAFGQLDEYTGYFPLFPANVRDTEIARSLGVGVGDEVVYYARRAYDLWNTRYFIVPYFANGWRDPQRGSASFMFRSVQIYPDPDQFTGPRGTEESAKWIDTRDVRVMRNLQEFPRAWVVRSVRAAAPTRDDQTGPKLKR